MAHEHVPMYEDLTPAEQQKLKALTADDLQIEVLNTFIDDHEQCVEARINGVEVGFWWLTREAAAAFEYADSKKAQGVILRVIADQARMCELEEGSCYQEDEVRDQDYYKRFGVEL